LLIEAYLRILPEIPSALNLINSAVMSKEKKRARAMNLCACELKHQITCPQTGTRNQKGTGEKHCPQSLKIHNELKKVAKEMENLLYYPTLFMVKKIMHLT
jgi:predicted aldo/keto reductase-like oxidoreductase